MDTLLDHAWSHRLTLLVAPAGSGKTTALSHFATRAATPVAWYRADGSDGSATRLLAHLERSLTSVMPDLAGGWSTTEDAVHALERWDGGQAALLVDDLHALRGTSAEAELALLLDWLPPQVVVIAAGRTPPGFDVSRLRVAGDLLELGADDLRFRTWETEQLFRDVYGTALGPEDVARLTRQVEGWAAGLQLYHLAARSKPPAEQRRLITVASSRNRLAREYLARNVLDGLSGDLQGFLVDTSVFGVLTGGLCDKLTGRTDSARLLEQLERARLFTFALDEEGTYRYHEVLRAQLETLLVERDGERHVQQRFQRAGALLEDAGHPAEALRCYGRAQDWAAVERLAGDAGAGGSWLAALPDPMVATDPWLLLARARERCASGAFLAAMDDYHSVERLAGTEAVADTARRERAVLATVLDPGAPAATGWVGALRQALRRDPLGLEPGDPPHTLAAAAAALAAGCPASARPLLDELLARDDTPRQLFAAAALAGAVSDLFATGTADASRVEEAESLAEKAEAGWVARLARAALACTERARGAEEAGRVRDERDAAGDRWGAALAGLLLGLGGLRPDTAHDGRAALADSALRFHALDAPVLEALARGALALLQSRAGLPEAAATAASAERLARAVGAHGARALALTAVARSAAPGRRAQAAAAAAAQGAECGLFTEPAGLESPTTAASVELRCFGSFAVLVGGAPVDLAAVRPRARSALRLLALHGGRPIHKEVLLEALWPGTDPDSGLRNLQVAVSSLRQVLPSELGLGVVRDADSYRLALPDGTRSDLVGFDDAVARARQAAGAGDSRSALAAAADALEAHSGELLADEGPADWVVHAREQRRADAVAMAVLAADAALGLGRPSEAAEWCARGLATDRFSDRLWKLLEQSHDAAGDVASAARTRAAYAEVRRELGLS